MDIQTILNIGLVIGITIALGTYLFYAWLAGCGQDPSPLVVGFAVLE